MVLTATRTGAPSVAWMLVITMQGELAVGDTRVGGGPPWLPHLLHTMCDRASSGSEFDDEPSSRATSLQPSVCVTGSLRWVGVGHAECDGSRLHELPEAIKFLELTVVRAHRGRRERDATLWLACETTYRRKRATVADGRNHPFVED